MKKNKKVLIILLSVAIVAVAVLIYAFTGSAKTQIVAETVTVKKGNICSVVTATGKIEPVLTVSVGTQVSGVVQKIYVDFNSQVKAGQLIAELDKTNLLATVAEAKANLNSALNEKEYLQNIFNRQEALYKSRAISQADYEEALYKLNAAKNTVEQRRSDLNRAQTNLGYADIYSPIDGVVLSKAVDVGQTVAASFSTPTLFTIAQDLSNMQVEANVDEADIGSVKEGQKVKFTVDAFSGETFEGVVSQVRLNAAITSNVVTYTVIISTQNPDMKLMPGLTATIGIYTSVLENVLTLQAKALNYKADTAMIAQYNLQAAASANPGMAAQPNQNPVTTSGATKTAPTGVAKRVWIKNPQGIYARTVYIGESDGINVPVLSGLKEGDQVVFQLSEATGAMSGSQSGGSEKSPFMPTPPGKKSKSRV